MPRNALVSGDIRTGEERKGALSYVVTEPAFWLSLCLMRDVRPSEETHFPSELPDIDIAIATLRHDIHKGHFVPGQRLIEADLVERFRISRAKIREALRVLQQERLVQIDRNKGASVRRVDRQEVRDTLELLRVLSILMAEKTLDRRGEPEVAARVQASLELARHFREHSASPGEPRAFMDENARFWSVLAELSDNPILIATRMQLETTLFRLGLEGSCISGDPDLWIAGHEQILSAVASGDRRQVRKLVASAVLAVQDAILALPDRAFGL